jgi:hypothetical protein
LLCPARGDIMAEFHKDGRLTSSSNRARDDAPDDPAFVMRQQDYRDDRE